MPTSTAMVENRLIDLLTKKRDEGMFNEEEEKIVKDWVFLAVASQEVKAHFSQYCDLPSRGY